MRNNNMYKMVIIDLDGTLLNSEGKVSKFTEKTIKQCIKQGNIFCIATARPFRSTSAIYEQLNLKSIALITVSEYRVELSEIECSV